MNESTSTPVALIICGILFLIPGFFEALIKFGNAIRPKFMRIPVNSGTLALGQITGWVAFLVGCIGLIVGTLML